MPSTLIIIPGACCPSHLYNPFIQAFPPGHDIRVLDLTTVRDKALLFEGTFPEDEPPSMYSDANSIAEHVLAVVAEGKDVVLMPHSYGGTPTTEALAIIKKAGGFKVDREGKGEKGGVKGVGYMTCLLPSVGNGAGSVQPEENPNAIPFEITDLGWLAHVNYPRVADICCNLLPSRPSAIAFVKKFGYHAARSFADPLTSMTVQGLNVSWLFCEEDLCISPEVQQGGINRLNDALGEGKEVKVTRIRADHIPNESAREETVRWVVGLLG